MKHEQVVFTSSQQDRLNIVYGTCLQKALHHIQYTLNILSFIYIRSVMFQGVYSNHNTLHCRVSHSGQKSYGVCINNVVAQVHEHRKWQSDELFERHSLLGRKTQY